MRGGDRRVAHPSLTYTPQNPLIAYTQNAHKIVSLLVRPPRRKITRTPHQLTSVGVALIWINFSAAQNKSIIINVQNVLIRMSVVAQWTVHSKPTPSWISFSLSDERRRSSRQRRQFHQLNGCNVIYGRLWILVGKFNARLACDLTSG